MHATLHTGGVVTGARSRCQGTTSNPVFKPDVKGMVSNRLKSAGATKAKGLLHGLLGK